MLVRLFFVSVLVLLLTACPSSSDLDAPPASGGTISRRSVSKNRFWALLAPYSPRRWLSYPLMSRARRRRNARWITRSS